MFSNELDLALRQTDCDYSMLQKASTSSAAYERGIWFNHLNGERGYLGYLPTFQNQTFLEILETKVQQNFNGNDITFVDCGYGRGRALIGLSEYPPLQKKVKLVGVGPPAHSKLEVKTDDGRIFPPTYEKLIQQGIILIDKNIVRIKEVIPESSADVVVAAFSLYTIRYPSWEIIKNIYSILKPSGVFISNDSCPILLGHDPYFLSEYLTNLGYVFEVHNTEEEPFRDMIWGFSMQKTLAELPNTIVSRESIGRHMVSITE